MLDFKCEICYDWCMRIKVTKQWWGLAKGDWELLNGKDLPYYIAILTVLREATLEIFDENTTANHSNLKEDKRGYALSANENCQFTPLNTEQRNKWQGMRLAIRAFRNGAAHNLEVNPMNPVQMSKDKKPQDPSQDYYRYAPYPSLYRYNNLNDPAFNDEKLKNTCF
jgi:hypothetical protein